MSKTTTAPAELPGEEVGHDIMQEAAKRLGLKLPKASAAAAAAAPDPNAGRSEEEDLPPAERAAAKKKETEEAAAAEATAAAEAATKTEEEAEAERVAAEEAASAETAAATPEAKADAAENTKAVARLKDLAPELRTRVQEILDTRIGQIRAQSTEKVTAAEEKAAGLETRVSELATELEETKARGGAPVIVPGVHPLFLANTEAEIDGRLEQLERFEDWADANREGYEGDGTASDPSYTAEQIRARLREIRKEKERIIPAARKLLTERASDEAAARTAYPDFFDPKKPEYRARQAVFKALPELRRLPNAHTLALQFVLGEQALAERKKTAANGGKEVKLPPKAPRAPGTGGGGKGTVVVHKTDTPAAPQATKDYVKTKSHNALVSAARAFL